MHREIVRSTSLESTEELLCSPERFESTEELLCMMRMAGRMEGFFRRGNENYIILDCGVLVTRVNYSPLATRNRSRNSWQKFMILIPPINLNQILCGRFPFQYQLSEDYPLSHVSLTHTSDIRLHISSSVDLRAERTRKSQVPKKIVDLEEEKNFRMFSNTFSNHQLHFLQLLTIRIIDHYNTP